MCTIDAASPYPRLATPAPRTAESPPCQRFKSPRPAPTAAPQLRPFARFRLTLVRSTGSDHTADEYPVVVSLLPYQRRYAPSMWSASDGLGVRVHTCVRPAGHAPIRPAARVEPGAPSVGYLDDPARRLRRQLVARPQCQSAAAAAPSAAGRRVLHRAVAKARVCVPPRRCPRRGGRPVRGALLPGAAPRAGD